MSNAAGVVGRYTNHTARKTLITNLIQAGYPPTMIQSISGDKDVKSISHYTTTSREQIAQMNDILSNPEKITNRQAQITNRPVAIASGANNPVSHAANPDSITRRAVAIPSGANNPVSHAANPDSFTRREVAIASGANNPMSHVANPYSNDENIPPPNENVALSVVVQNDVNALTGDNSDKTSSSTSTMMMANTSELFHNTSFHGCTFTMSFGK